MDRAPRGGTHRDDPGGKRRATLRARTASLTTTGRTASGCRHGGRTGEGAR
ncbi:DUF6380 family protein [Streptomyces sp. NPDC001651]|uniref:DUF6380 family protein n=1 Tax=Streptomyces sp. NPDC001651 TaxID=3364596 RepID=UPI0036CAB97E